MVRRARRRVTTASNGKDIQGGEKGSNERDLVHHVRPCSTKYAARYMVRALCRYLEIDAADDLTALIASRLGHAAEGTEMSEPYATR